MRVPKNEVEIGIASSGMEDGSEVIPFSTLSDDRDSYEAPWRDIGRDGQTSEAR